MDRSLRCGLWALALLPSMALAEAGEYGGTELMNQTLARPAASDATATAAPAALSPAADVYEAEEVVVTGRSANLLGKADSASQGRVSTEDLNRRPLLRPAEVLEAVPGLMITQHSGDGKANQYFTRGFNLDHGTDFAFSADGVPVNLPSHAHGQGYSDLNFIIPDLIQEVDYRKGPYNVESGDFATAGSANFSYPFRLKNDLASMSLGEDGYVRALAAASIGLGRAGQFYYAVEGVHDDGPWDVPENFQKYNLLLHYGVGSASNGLVVALSVDEGAWVATNQTPQRAVDDGLIDRFGSLDPSDGGMTHRYSLWSTWKRSTDSNEATVEGYATLSSLRLWNDFTFDLNSNGQGVDVMQGGNLVNEPSDQIEEEDERSVSGVKARDIQHSRWAGIPSETEVGVDFRDDNVTTLGLYSTVQRVRQSTTSENTVVETDVAPYVGNTAHWTPWLRSELGYRQDFYAVNVGATLTARQAQQTESAPEPKVGVALGPWGPLELYGNYGLGFHSNDARILTPQSQQTQGASSAFLVPARGLEGGLRLAFGDYRGTVAVWQLKLDSELTFNGDTAGSQVGPASTRQGVEWSNNFHWRHLVLDGDYAFSQARFDSEDLVDDPMHPGTTVPESIEQAASGTLGLENLGPFSVDARIRYFGPRPLTPDDSVRSEGSLLTSIRLAYVPVKGQQLALDIFNLFNEQADDVSYYYVSQLKGESNPVDGLMVHPAEPREARASYRVEF